MSATSPAEHCGGGPAVSSAHGSSFALRLQIPLPPPFLLQQNCGPVPSHVSVSAVIARLSAAAPLSVEPVVTWIESTPTPVPRSTSVGGRAFGTAVGILRHRRKGSPSSPSQVGFNLWTNLVASGLNPQQGVHCC